MIRRRSFRVLMYSHDSFGLGHLRRCREIAHRLVEDRKDVSVLILSGSPIIGSFDFRTRVDFVRVPGVVKLRNGDYTSLSLHLDLQETLALRESIVRHTAQAFAPDMLIVDKEPLGLRGEMRTTLEDCHRRGTHLVLGIRDVMDEPEALSKEWNRKQVKPALDRLYDEIWVYGLPDVYHPVPMLQDDPVIRSKLWFTGYLRRSLPRVQPATLAVPSEPYLLVTAGGGGDGEEMVAAVLAAYEHAAGSGVLRSGRLLPAVVVTGPFMPQEAQQRFRERAEALGPKLRLVDFESHPEPLMAAAAGVVAMGGYNTFCEILSFDKPALILPREVPRLEQLIRAQRAAALGLVTMMRQEAAEADTARLVEVLCDLPNRAPPSRAKIEGLLDGLDRISARVSRCLDAPAAAARR